MYSFLLSIVIHSLIFFSFNIHAKKEKGQIISLSINNIEFVPSKVMEQETVVTTKTFHGKVKERKMKETVNKPIEIKGNEYAQKYFADVRKVFLENFTNSTKAQKLKLKGEVLVKIQIQKDGSYDTLFVGGQEPELVALANKTLSKISNFPPIPDSLGQSEIQLKVPLVYKFN